MSEALWACCMDNAPVTESKAKHHQMIPPVWTCPFGIPFANSQTVFPHSLHVHLQFRFEMDEGEHLRVNMGEVLFKGDSRIPALASSLRVRLPKDSCPSLVVLFLSSYGLLSRLENFYGRKNYR